MKTVFVTGGTGFVGKHLIDRLVADGHKVKSFDFRPLANPNQNPSVSYVLGDIRKEEDIYKHMESCDLVYHCAAIPSIARAKYDAYVDINVHGTTNVLSSALKRGIKKVVHVSSSTVYGIPKKFPLSESDTATNVGYYGRSKQDAENECLRFGVTNKDFSVSIIRPRVIMGAGRIGIFSILFDSILRGSPIFLIGSGRNVFQFTGVSDMVDGIVKSADYTKTEIFNVGAGDKTPVYEVMEQLIKHAGSKSRIILIPSWVARTGLAVATTLGISPLVNEQFQIADKNFMLDTSRAESDLKWSAKQTNFDCLREAFDWYRTYQSNRDPQFVRFLGIFGRFKHSQQGAYQNSKDGISI